MHLTLDIANELYPLREGETITLAIAKNLVEERDDDADRLDGEGVEGSRKVRKELWRGGDSGLANDYEYVMYGKVGVWVLDRFGLV